MEKVIGIKFIYKCKYISRLRLFINILTNTQERHEKNHTISKSKYRATTERSQASVREHRVYIWFSFYLSLVVVFPRYGVLKALGLSNRRSVKLLKYQVIIDYVFTEKYIGTIIINVIEKKIKYKSPCRMRDD